MPDASLGGLAAPSRNDPLSTAPLEDLWSAALAEARPTEAGSARNAGEVITLGVLFTRSEPCAAGTVVASSTAPGNAHDGASGPAGISEHGTAAPPTVRGEIDASAFRVPRRDGSETNARAQPEACNSGMARSFVAAAELTDIPLELGRDRPRLSALLARECRTMTCFWRSAARPSIVGVRTKSCTAHLAFLGASWAVGVPS